MMLIGPHYRRSGELPLIGEVDTLGFIRSSFEPALHLQGFATSEAYVKNAMRMVQMQNRWEVYVYDDALNPVAVAHYALSDDIHHGKVAVPVTVLVMAEHRNSKEVSRLLNSGIKQAVAYLGCSLYYKVKHISPTMQQHILRKL
uniref:Host range and adsorption protein n=1 Tax=Aeromonas phage vB_AdhaP_MF TaxID=3367373 RepID=A0AB74UPS6_9CAUD